VFPKALIAVLYHYGAVTPNDVQQAMYALMGYGVGLMGLVGVKVLAPGFYARQDTRTPVKIAVVVLVLTQVMNAIFVPFMGHAGLALSIGLGATINALWLFIGLRRRGTYAPMPGWGAFTLRVMLASAALGGLLWWTGQHIDWTGLGDHKWTRIGLVAACLSGAAALYFGTLIASGMKLREFARRG
jgi:putative peptidoglycan lipid II flippase